MKYRYSHKLNNPDCKHEWGDLDKTDGTQFCIKCGNWRCPMKTIEDRCYICKETRYQATQLMISIDGKHYVCDNCLREKEDK